MRGGYKLGRQAGSTCRCGNGGKGVFTGALASEFTELQIAKALLFVYSNPICLDSIIVCRFGPPPLYLNAVPQSQLFLVLYRNPIPSISTSRLGMRTGYHCSSPRRHSCGSILSVSSILSSESTCRVL